MKSKDPLPNPVLPAPKLKSTLKEFLECIPPQWRDAEVAIGIEKSNYIDQGDYRVRRVILTVDNNGRRCVIFSRHNSNLI